MRPAAARAPALPFFLDATPGRRFCLYHAAQPGSVDAHSGAADPGCRGAVVMVHAFAEEMNRSRRMCALAARLLADAGIAVLVVDLYGCGDSDGDFGQARWDIWRSDLMHARRWLEQRTGMTAGFLGVRLGALLALDAAAHDDRPTGPLVFWQPVLRGETYLTQFLRLGQAAAMVAHVDGSVDGAVARSDRPSRPEAKPTETSAAGGLRQALLRGEDVEVAGYTVAAALCAAIDEADMASIGVPSTPVYWFDLASQAGSPLPPARARAMAALRARGMQLEFQTLVGPAFWATQEISTAPALLAATVTAVAGQPV